MKIGLKILVGVGVAVIMAGFVYFFVIPPMVVKVVPEEGKENVGLDTSITIRFDKPIKRQEIKHFIIPQVHGEWRFEEPIIKNHLFRTLVFVPAVDFKPDTKYQINLEHIVSPLGINLFPGKFSFRFRTQEILPKAISQEIEPEITLLDIPLDWQDYALSCEAACLKMALGFKGVKVSEDEIMEKIGYDLTPRKDNIWGDPYQAYVGEIDGKICATGYGVYWTQVAEAAGYWREAEVISNGNLQRIAQEIKVGNLVIFWGVLPEKELTDCSWQTTTGKYIKALKETHVRLAIGFMGDSASPTKIIINDPLSGRLFWSPEQFLTNWAVFDYTGVVIK